MKKQVLIVKTGSTLPSLAAKKGDFEDWILGGMGLDRGGALVVDVTAGVDLPSCDRLAGVAVTGSHAMVTERTDWSERTAEWLSGAVSEGIPTLGICYGHQLLAYALGGVVGDNPRGREIGTVDVRLNGNARHDKLLGGFQSPLRVHESHRQAVLKLPETAIPLASSDMDENQAFVVGGFAWGLQFHPEFDEEIAVDYIEHYRIALRWAGMDVDALIRGCTATPCGYEILRRFRKIAVGR